ncbi:MAG: DUF2764 family protein [Candidatus Omnitrophica bacterium]|nr:DUF2764 family protein [Candidatus Omnitrophota bacterium]
MLHFNMSAPISFEKFLLLCRDSIPQDDRAVLENIPLRYEYEGRQETIKKIVAFEIMLRNELVKVRAARKKSDAAKYLRPDGYAGPALYHLVLAALRNPSPLDAERSLDLERWDFLDGLSFGRYFDLDFLIIYAYKLLILERWQRINSADKGKLLDETLSQEGQNAGK